ncbi:hypothetical protein D3C85_1400580 [compost metagenome]
MTLCPANLILQCSVQASTIAQPGQAVRQCHVSHGLVRMTQLPFHDHSLAQLTQDDQAEHRQYRGQEHQHPSGFQ